MTKDGPILRIFEVRTKEGCSETLLKNFETTSIDVVRNKSGNLGYFYGNCVQGAHNVVMFVSVWENLDAIKNRFGDDWQKSYLPDGYAELIEECSIRHLDASSGWHVANIS